MAQLEILMNGAKAIDVTDKMDDKEQRELFLFKNILFHNDKKPLAKMDSEDYIQCTALDNQLAMLLRVKPGAFMKVQQLIGDELLRKLWEHQEIQDKLINRNFFLDKKCLLIHYYRSITSPHANDRIKELLSANLC
uniref:Transcriptional regulator n=1 Tax=Globodera pallida TaxID=36090 RepID=A0A183BN72_GLOPA